jgi:two-component system response regulator LytT
MHQYGYVVLLERYDSPGKEQSLKVKLLIDTGKYESVYRELTEHGIEVSDDAELIVTENRDKSYLPVKNQKGERVMIDCEDIVYIESYGHRVDVHTNEEIYSSQDRIYMLEESLNPRSFIRVSNSVIVSKKHVTKIRPALSMKFVITMTDGTVIDVTRSYYASFRTFFGI